MNVDDPSSRTLSTLVTTFRIVDTLERMGHATAVELTEALDLSKSAVYNHLTTLKQYGYVVQDGEYYTLSLEFLRLGEFVRNNNDLYTAGREPLEDLANSTGEYVHLSVEERGRLMHLYKVKGDRAVGEDFQTNKMYDTSRLHYTATGKAILAHLPRARVEEILDDRTLESKTQNTTVSPAELYEELKQIRRLGYSQNDEEQIKGLRAVGAPIIDSEDRVKGAISISGPTSRLTGAEFHDRIPELVTRTANIIEVNMNMSAR